MLSILEGGKVPARGHQHWPGSAGRLFGGGGSVSTKLLWGEQERWRLTGSGKAPQERVERWECSDYVQGRVRGPTGAAREGRRGSNSDYCGHLVAELHSAGFEGAALGSGLRHIPASKSS